MKTTLLLGAGTLGVLISGGLLGAYCGARPEPRAASVSTSLPAPPTRQLGRTEVKCYPMLSERAKRDAFVLCDRLGGKVSHMHDEVSCWSGEPYEDGSRTLFVYTLEQARADDRADAEDGGAP